MSAPDVPAPEPAVVIAPRDRLLALSIIFIRALKLLALRLGLDQMPSLALCTWRFVLSFFPACLMVRRPKSSWRLMIGFGLITGIGQFGALATAMQGHVSAGLASALVQIQAVINVALAGLWLREPIRRVQVVGCRVSSSGLTFVLIRADANATLLGVLLVFVAASSWAVCNVLLKAGGYTGDILSFLVWTSPIAGLSLAGLSIAIEGPSGLLIPLAHGGRGTLVHHRLAGIRQYAVRIFDLELADPPLFPRPDRSAHASGPRHRHVANRDIPR